MMKEPMFIYTILIIITVPERGACVITITEFPEYVRRMQRRDDGKMSMLANEYEVSYFIKSYLCVIHCFL